MELVPRGDAVPTEVTNYGSRSVTSLALAGGAGEAHAYRLEFGPGGIIDRHVAGFGQLLVIVSGSGWVAGGDGVRRAVRNGDVAHFARGEEHAKGSDTGMTAIMIQVRDLDPR
jgi:quercetin dioxygenase-like cupin family protein